jgi:hypothetical protein
MDDAWISRTNGTTSSQIFLIQHSKGHFCYRFRVIEDGLIVPVSTQLPYAQIELHFPSEVDLLGVVDLEIRPTLNVEQPEVPKELSKRRSFACLGLRQSHMVGGRRVRSGKVRHPETPVLVASSTMCIRQPRRPRSSSHS